MFHLSPLVSQQRPKKSLLQVLFCFSLSFIFLIINRAVATNIERGSEVQHGTSMSKCTCKARMQQMLRANKENAESISDFNNMNNYLKNIQGGPATSFLQLRVACDARCELKNSCDTLPELLDEYSNNSDGIETPIKQITDCIGTEDKGERKELVNKYIDVLLDQSLGDAKTKLEELKKKVNEEQNVVQNTVNVVKEEIIRKLGSLPCASLYGEISKVFNNEVTATMTLPEELEKCADSPKLLKAIKEILEQGDLDVADKALFTKKGKERWSKIQVEIEKSNKFNNGLMVALNDNTPSTKMAKITKYMKVIGLSALKILLTVVDSVKAVVYMSEECVCLKLYKQGTEELATCQREVQSIQQCNAMKQFKSFTSIDTAVKDALMATASTLICIAATGGVGIAAAIVCDAALFMAGQGLAAIFELDGPSWVDDKLVDNYKVVMGFFKAFNFLNQKISVRSSDASNNGLVNQNLATLKKYNHAYYHCKGQNAVRGTCYDRYIADADMKCLTDVNDCKKTDGVKWYDTCDNLEECKSKDNKCTPEKGYHCECNFKGVNKCECRPGSGNLNGEETEEGIEKIEAYDVCKYTYLRTKECDCTKYESKAEYESKKLAEKNEAAATKQAIANESKEDCVKREIVEACKYLKDADLKTKCEERQDEESITANCEDKIRERAELENEATSEAERTAKEEERKDFYDKASQDECVSRRVEELNKRSITPPDPETAERWAKYFCKKWKSDLDETKEEAQDAQEKAKEVEVQVTALRQKHHSEFYKDNNEFMSEHCTSQSLKNTYDDYQERRDMAFLCQQWRESVAGGNQ